MTKNPAKDFGLIAEDYAFFENSATEAHEDARAYAEVLQKILPAAGEIRMLDFGCGTGAFTERLLTEVGWPPERVRLTLVEPIESVRREAAPRLAPFTGSAIVESAALPPGIHGRFDVVLANHCLYYVPDLPGHLTKLLEALSAGGIFAAAVAGRTNALIGFWIAGFRLLGREIPYHTSEDVEAALLALGADYQKQSVAYELTFPDTEENRMRVIRFLLSDHLAQIPCRPLLDMFDQYSRADRIEIRTASDHFTVRSVARG
jgi:SAM-dependent methyltransferase